MPVTIVPRPVELDGCMQTWNEQHTPQVLRTQTDFQTVKVRRRVTGSIYNVSGQVTLEAELYDVFMKWFLDDCQAGVLPTYFKRPRDNAEIALRFTEAPSIEWIDRKAFRASLKLEQLPEWLYAGAP
jgi:hypothetical protein